MPAGNHAPTRSPRRWERRLQRAVWGDDAGDADPGVRLQRRLVVRPAVALACAAMLLGALHTFATPPFAPPDETSHLAYALAVTDGHRPLVDEFPDTTRLPYWREGLSVWTANHPPLYNLLAGVPLRIGEATGQGLAGIWGARLVSVGSFGLGLLLAAWLMVVLVPGRPVLAVAAPGIVGFLPHFVHVSGIAYNDALAFCMTTATLLAAAVVLRRGPSPRRNVLLALVAAAAAGTRVSGLLVLGIAGLVAGSAPLLHGPGSPIARLRRGVAHGLLVAAVAAATFGWVYVQNLSRYGGLTATGTLLDMFNREPRGLFWLRLVRRGIWRDVHTQWWSRMDSTSHLPDVLLIPLRWWALLVALGLLAVAVRRLASARWRPPPRVLVLWLPPLGLLVGTVLTFGQFVARGGSPHARYFMPTAAVLGAIAATGLLALPGRRRGLPVAACTLSLLVANVVVLYRYATYADLYGPVLVVRRWAMLGEPALVPAAVVVVALLAASYAVFVVSLWRLGAEGAWQPSRTGRRDPRPLPARDPAAAALAAALGGLTGVWSAYWFLDWLPLPLGAAAGLLAAALAVWLVEPPVTAGRTDDEHARVTGDLERSP